MPPSGCPGLEQGCPLGGILWASAHNYIASAPAQRAGALAPWGHRPQGKDLPAAAHVAASAGALAGVWRRAAQCGFAKYPFSGPNVCGGGPKNCPQ